MVRRDNEDDLGGVEFVGTVTVVDGWKGFQPACASDSVEADGFQ